MQEWRNNERVVCFFFECVGGWGVGVDGDGEGEGRGEGGGGGGGGGGATFTGKRIAGTGFWWENRT